MFVKVTSGLLFAKLTSARLPLQPEVNFSIEVLEYCEMMSTEQLRALLREECLGQGSLPTQATLDICAILADRNPNKPDVNQMLWQLCEQYLS